MQWLAPVDPNAHAVALRAKGFLDDAEGLPAVVAELGAFSKVTVTDDSALVAVIGERMNNAGVGLAGRVFTAIGEADVPIQAISYGATKTNLQIVVPQARERDTVRALHAVLFDSP